MNHKIVGFYTNGGMNMEIEKELPEIFEEFGEQRQKSFLMVKQLKDQGIPVIGAYCTYFPQELAMAMYFF